MERTSFRENTSVILAVVLAVVPTERSDIEKDLLNRLGNITRPQELSISVDISHNIPRHPNAFGVGKPPSVPSGAYPVTT